MLSAIYLFSTLVVSHLSFAQVVRDVNIQCVPLRECPDITHLVRANDPEYVQTILKLSNCGYDNNHHPKVWCPVIIISDCVTPDKKPGRCKPIQDCEAFRDLLQFPDDLAVPMKVFLYRHRCKDATNTRGFSVCCPGSSVLYGTSKPPVVDTSHLFPTAVDGECGQQLLYKIVGGKETEMDEHPWTALLEFDDGNDKTLGCGGTLINNRYVVTAAHCADTNAIRRLGNLNYVILGEYETRNESDCITRLGITECADAPLKMPVENITVHPQWYTKPAGTIDHDIALIRLANPVTFTDYIKPICLPTSNLTFVQNQNFEVVGWGQTEKGRVSTVKLKAQLPLYNRKQCADKYKLEKRLNIGDGEMCAGGEEGKDSCTGDSGGPLMLSVEKPEYSAWFLAGVVSFGPNQPCGVKNYPGLYTFLPKYVDWIRETVKP